MPFKDAVRVHVRDARRSPFPYLACFVVVAAFLAGMRFAHWREGFLADALAGYTYGQWLLHVLLALVLVTAGAFAVQRVLDEHAAGARARFASLTGALLAWWAVAAVAVAAGLVLVWAASVLAGHELLARAFAWSLASLVLGAGAFIALGLALGAVGRTAAEAVAAALTGWALMGPAFDQVFNDYLRIAWRVGGDPPAWAAPVAHVTPLTPLRRFHVNADPTAWMQGLVNVMGFNVVILAREAGGPNPVRDGLALAAWAVAGLLVAWGVIAYRDGARRLEATV